MRECRMRPICEISLKIKTTHYNNIEPDNSSIRGIPDMMSASEGEGVMEKRG